MKEDHTLKNNLEIPVFLYEQQPRNWQLMLECVSSIAKKQQFPRLIGKYCIARRDSLETAVRYDWVLFLL